MRQEPGDAETSIASAPLPLTGLVVLDLTLARAGPTCVRHLADWGADVIRVQPPDDGGEEVVGKRTGSDYQNLHRNKRVITLDLKTPAGHEAFLRLVRKADVLVENMRAPVKHKLGIAWEDLKAVNPRLVYGSISGFGQSGPYAGRAGVDQIAQGMGGLMSITGAPGGGPMRAGIAVADLTAGNLLAFAVMTALYEREKTGVGRYVHTSLLEGQIFMLDFQAARYLTTGKVPAQAGNQHPTVVPTGVFETSDGYVNIAASSSGQWRRFCTLLGREDWLENPLWAAQADRSRNRGLLEVAIAEEIRRETTAYWVDRLDSAGLPCGPIYTIDQVFNDPQVRHLNMATSIENPDGAVVHMIASPLNVDGVEKTIRNTVATSGVHTAEVLAELGYSATDIEAMRRDGVI